MPVPYIALIAGALLFATSCAAPEDGSDGSSAGSQLQYGAISIELPNGWDGRILRVDDRSAVLQAANFKFLPVGVELPPGEVDSIKAMTADHALVAILPCGMVSFEERPRRAPGRVSLEDLTFLPSGQPRIPVGHAFAQGSFYFSGRCLRVEADFGSSPPRRNLIDAANAVIGSLFVEMFRDGRPGRRRPSRAP
ncbi:MAG TPA: hypothetical protein VFL41_13725 [Gaiellaceae bacterium]|nr:hypothetical protein [Gaiellaceae bacterium]